MDALRSLTHDEARQRSALLTVTGYDIDVDLTGLEDGTTLVSVCTVRFSCVEPGASTFVDCVGELRTASLNGSPLDLGTWAAGRLPLTNLASDNVLVVEMVQTDTESRSGVHRAVDPADKNVYVWMTFEADDARRVWACFDQPDLKAPHTFTVLAPASWTVLSDSDDPVVEDADEARRWRFPATPPLSTYVPVINAGPFYELRAERDGYDLGLQCRQSLAHVLDRDADELFALTAAGLAFFGERFAMPFPQRSYDQVFVPDYGGAMENFGCITWSDSYLYRSAPTYQEREERAGTLLHEMAHMWFGDIVTMRWWDDLWLNEAFAEWACMWACTQATEFTDAWAGFLLTGKRWSYPIDRGQTTHPIRQPAPDVATADASFDAITYQKGCSTLKQLAVYVGEDAFVAGLRTHFATHQWGNATLEDLMSALSEASGRDLTRWSEQWLDRSGVDTLALDRSGDDVQLRAVGPDGGAPRPHRLAIGVYRRSGDQLTRSDVVPVDVDGATTTLPLMPVSELLLLNDDDLTYASVRPDPAALAALIDQAERLPTATARAVAAVTLNDLLMTGDVAPREVLSTLTRLVAAETSDSAIEPLLDMASQLVRYYAGDDVRPALAAELASACVALVEQGGVRRLTALRGLSPVATTAAHLDLLTSAAVDDVDVAWRTLIRRAALGDVATDDATKLEERDPDPDAWARRVAVDAAQPSTEAKDRAWQHAFDEHFPYMSLHELSLAFWQPDQAELLAPYADRFLAELPALNDKAAVSARAQSSWMFPFYGVDEGFARRVEEHAALPTTTPLIRVRLLECVDRLRRMLRSRATSART